LQDRLVKELTLAAITTVEAADCYIRDVYIPALNARFVVKAVQEDSAFVAIPGVDLNEALCVRRPVERGPCERRMNRTGEVPVELWITQARYPQLHRPSISNEGKGITCVAESNARLCQPRTPGRLTCLL
jgi:hypothetical protein